MLYLLQTKISKESFKISFSSFCACHTSRVYVFHSFPLQTTVNDFAARSVGILQEAMRWAPNITRSHLMEYLLRVDNTSKGLYQHSGLALATESVLNYAGYNRASASLGVSA